MEEEKIDWVYGCVTTGEDWQFLRLEVNQVTIDSQRYYISELELVLGVFQAILAGYGTMG